MIIYQIMSINAEMSGESYLLSESLLSAFGDHHTLKHLTRKWLSLNGLVIESCSKAAPLRDKLQATSSQQGGIIPAHALDYNVI